MKKNLRRRAESFLFSVFGLRIFIMGIVELFYICAV